MTELTTLASEFHSHKDISRHISLRPQNTREPPVNEAPRSGEKKHIEPKTNFPFFDRHIIRLRTRRLVLEVYSGCKILRLRATCTLDVFMEEGDRAKRCVICTWQGGCNQHSWCVGRGTAGRSRELTANHHRSGHFDWTCGDIIQDHGSCSPCTEK